MRQLPRLVVPFPTSEKLWNPLDVSINGVKNSGLVASEIDVAYGLSILGKEPTAQCQRQSLSQMLHVGNRMDLRVPRHDVDDFKGSTFISPLRTPVNDRKLAASDYMYRFKNTIELH